MPRDIAHPAHLPHPRIRHARLRRVSLLSQLLALRALARQRRQLAKLDDHQLRDVGLTRSEAQREADRPFWDAPRHWRR